MKYRVMVNVYNDVNEDTWTGNRVTYPTAEAARVGAIELANRWLMVRYWRVVDDKSYTVYHTNKPEVA